MTLGSPQPSLVSTMYEVHVVACTIDVEPHTATVDVRTNQLLGLSPPHEQVVSREWEAWSAPKNEPKWDVWSTLSASTSHHDKWVSFAIARSSADTEWIFWEACFSFCKRGSTSHRLVHEPGRSIMLWAISSRNVIRAMLVVIFSHLLPSDFSCSKSDSTLTFLNWVTALSLVWPKLHHFRGMFCATPTNLNRLYQGPMPQFSGQVTIRMLRSSSLT